MAEVNAGAGENRQTGKVRRKNLSTRIDLTPMVDLGFLLITFFIFTYQLSRPKAMDLYMPTEKGDSSNLGESTAFTILACGNNKIFYYQGTLEEALRKGQFGFSNYSLREGIGNKIREKQAALEKVKPGYKRELMLIIKPGEQSRFENIVNLLDEVLINNVSHYAIVDPSYEERILMDTKKMDTE